MGSFLSRFRNRYRIFISIENGTYMKQEQAHIAGTWQMFLVLYSSVLCFVCHRFTPFFLAVHVPVMVLGRGLPPFHNITFNNLSLVEWAKIRGDATDYLHFHFDCDALLDHF